MTGMHTIESGNIARPLSLKLRIKNVNKRSKIISIMSFLPQNLQIRLY